MTLPKVHVKLTADGMGEVWLNDHKVPAVLAVHISGAAGDMPRVVMTIRPGELTADLPETGVQILRDGPSATDFVRSVNAVALEQEIVDTGDLGTSFGQGAVQVLARLAAEFDDRR